MRKFICAIALLHTCFLLFSQFWYTGHSFDSSLLALALPWMGVYAFIALPMVIYHAGATSALILGVYVLFLIKSEYKKAFMPLLASFCILFGGYVATNFQAESIRLAIWKAHLEFYMQKALFWNGFGLGNWQDLSPLIEVRGQRFIWSHNDWLHIFLEHGPLGLMACVWIFLWTLWINRNDNKLLAMLIAYAVCMMFYSPLQTTWGLVLFLGLIYKCIEGDKWIRIIFHRDRLP